MFRQRLTPAQALPKIKQYCAYQDRSHQEVKQKLFGYGLYGSDVEKMLSQLIEENFVDEERFAKLFVGGKFRTKKWGRKKIEYQLKQKNISPYCIKAGMKEIDETVYKNVLLDLATKKWASLKAEQHIVREVKTRAFLAQRGFEAHLVSEVLKEIRGK